MMSLIELQNVDMCFKGFRKTQLKVLDGINLNIELGEIISVVGESGCGKTTLGKVLADIYKPTRGKVLFEGRDMEDIRRDSKAYRNYRLSVQMIHQDSYAALNPNKTILHSLSLPILEHKMVKNSKELVELLEERLNEVGLNPPWQFLEKYPHQLSGGQRQRILLARALLFKTKLIIADEPVSMVDVSLRISLLDLMNNVKDKYGVSFVYITHDLATARYIAKNGRIAIMYLGNIVEENNIEKALEHPKHPYFHALLASSPHPYRTIRLSDLPLKNIEVPNIYELPSGCKFHPRCPHADERCESEIPELRSIDGSLVACHKAENISFKLP